MNKEIKGYLLHCDKTKYPIGKETPLKDINGKDLLTGDVVLLKDGNITDMTVVCTPRGDIMGIWGTNQNIIHEYKVKKIKSYKDLKNEEKFKGYDLKVVLKNTKQNKVKNIKHIINGRTTIVILEDGSKGITKCHPNEEFDEKEGFKRAYARANGEEIDDEGNELKVNKELWNKFINDEAVISYDSFEDMEFLIDYLHEQGFREVHGFDGENLKRINLQNVWNLHNCIRVRDVEDKRVAFHETDDGFIQQCFEIITFKELFNLIPPKQLSDYTNEELLEELKNRLK